MRGFWRPLDGVEFTAETGSQKMRHLVNTREEIFRRQRQTKLSDPLGRTRIERYVNQKRATNICYSNALGRYIEFCEEVDVPPLPMSHALIALCIYAKASWRNGAYFTMAGYFRRARKDFSKFGAGREHGWKEHGWKDDDSHYAALALTEFMCERGHVLIREGGGTVCDTSTSWTETDSRSSSPSECSDGESGSNGGEGPRPAAASVEQVPTPNLPRDGEIFDTVDEMHLACYVPLVLAYGNGARLYGRQSVIRCGRGHALDASATGGRCPWRMVGSPDETGKRIVIQYSESHLVHNHGPRPELIRDPNWRPIVKNTEARRRLGMSERWTSKAQAPLNNSGSRINMAGSTSSPRRPPSSSTTDSTKRRRLSASTAVQDSVLPRSMSSLNSQPSTSLPARSILAQFVEPSPHSRLARTVPREQIPLSDVASFLAGLDPSLASLAPSLYSAGYDSFEMISAIVSYEPSTLERVLRTVVNATASVGREGGEALTVGLVQLLIKKLDEARKGGWA